MKSLTKALVLHPSDQEAAWLGRATALHIARRDWIGTLLIALTAFVAMRVMHAGPIRSLMVAIVALAAAAGKRRYADMALALITAEAAALPALLAPLRLDSAALAPLEASLAMLPARALAGDDAGSGATA